MRSDHKLSLYGIPVTSRKKLNSLFLAVRKVLGRGTGSSGRTLAGAPDGPGPNAT